MDNSQRRRDIGQRDKDRNSCPGRPAECLHVSVASLAHTDLDTIDIHRGVMIVAVTIGEQYSRVLP